MRAIKYKQVTKKANHAIKNKLAQLMLGQSISSASVTSSTVSKNSRQPLAEIKESQVEESIHRGTNQDEIKLRFDKVNRRDQSNAIELEESFTPSRTSDALEDLRKPKAQSSTPLNSSFTEPVFSEEDREENTNNLRENTNLRV
jgi:hypothetical protein